MLSGQAFLQFPVFLETVEKCDNILKLHGMHVIDMLTNKQESTFNNILNTLVGITVMQVLNYTLQNKTALISIL